MKYYFELRVDAELRDVHLWNQLWRAYIRNRLDSYIREGFKSHEYQFRRVIQLFQDYRDFIVENAPHYHYDAGVVNSFRFWFDATTQTVKIGARGAQELKKIKAIEYGLPITDGRGELARHVFSRLTERFYIYLSNQGLI